MSTPQPTLLGSTRRQRGIPTEGIIRPGIRVLTSRAKGHEHADKAVKIYDYCVRTGRSFEVAQQQIEKQCGIKNALMPRNVAYFTSHKRDWPSEWQADRFLELYGEEYDDAPGRHVYRFPLVFPIDDWTAVLPHQLGTWKSNELAYCSEFMRSVDNTEWERVCTAPRELKVDPKSKRAPRVFEGRGRVVREDQHIQRLCAPEACPQYQAGDCKLYGSIIGFIPGVSGSQPARIPLTSYYGLDGAREQMEHVARIRPISGFTRDAQPFWWVSKKQDEISRIDRETGRPKKVKQWITHLTADIDLLEEIKLRDGFLLEGPTQDTAPPAAAPEPDIEGELERELEEEAGEEFDPEDAPSDGDWEPADLDGPAWKD